MEAGDLVGVRFKGNYGTYEFDNIFTTAEPYYMRAGVGTLVKVGVSTPRRYRIQYHIIREQQKPYLAATESTKCLWYY